MLEHCSSTPCQAFPYSQGSIASLRALNAEPMCLWPSAAFGGDSEYYLIFSYCGHREENVAHWHLMQEICKLGLYIIPASAHKHHFDVIPPPIQSCLWRLLQQFLHKLLGTGQWLQVSLMTPSWSKIWDPKRGLFYTQRCRGPDNLTSR